MRFGRTMRAIVAAEGSTGMRILVVDDATDSRELTEAALASAGYTDVVTAGSAWDAMKVLDIGRTADDTTGADLVLLDIVMPEMDGIEACARIRADRRYADIPIIMVTSLDDMGALANAFVAGANDYIIKPINRIELAARVRSALKVKAELERRQARERELLTFLSTWGDRRANLWIDEATGLFVGEIAEAYITAGAEHAHDDVVSVIALELDRFDAYRAAHGEAAGQDMLARVARAVRGIAGTVGIIPAAYRNGMIVLVAPDLDATAARQLGETLCTTVSRMRLSNAASTAADRVTASVAAVTGHVRRGVDRICLLTQAIAKVQDVIAAGGNRVLALSV
ncbi:MAG TPA: response regulator [Xanthobacteraceae bacterium]|nr:response regulator [Xanthobacteraceae bacterium]